ncbi:MAG: 7TM diverse intracellular signaling domain-containing protein, partial [Bdellovibrionota bacterium]|nr:7TM diverse intracellular signaling domain-containing protein [Bdellovibrionota bacterium]
FINFLKYLFTDHIHNLVLKWLWRTTLVGVLIIILTPVHIFTEIQDFFQIVLILSVIYLLTQITRATIQKTPFAKICLLGIFLLGIGVVGDIIVARNDLSHFTTSIFIFIQSYIISKKFSLAFGLVEKLNVELEEKVKERTKEISTLLNNLESSIFSVTKDLRVVTHFLNTPILSSKETSKD